MQSTVLPRPPIKKTLILCIHVEIKREKGDNVSGNSAVFAARLSFLFFSSMLSTPTAFSRDFFTLFLFPLLIMGQRVCLESEFIEKESETLGYMA